MEDTNKDMNIDKEEAKKVKKVKKEKNTVDIRRFSMINLVEKSRVQSVILKPNVENRRENGRFEAGENECLCRNKENIR